MIHLHVHTERGSILDSILTVKDIVNFAKNNGQDAIAVTDHGSMAAYVEQWKECVKNGIKPIIGCEVYEANDMSIKTETKENKLPRYHLILLAKNEVGLVNLFKIVSAGYLDGFYKKPRIDLEFIERNNLGNGLVCLTACMGGRFSRFAQGKADDKYTPHTYIKKLQDIFDYVALEIQAHDTEKDAILNKKIVNYAKKNNLPYVVTCDAHMLTKDQQESHGIYVQIGTAREVGETYDGCYLQTEDEVRITLTKQLDLETANEAIAETHKIADMIEDFEIGIDGVNHMPKIEIPKGFSSNMEYFRHIIDTNFPIKFGHMTKEEQQIRRDRIEMEIPVLDALGYIDYFLMLNMLTVEAKKRKIPLGYSRGSGANCLCLFMLNVTQIDSVRWNLDFSRFANLGRKSVADYDMDIAQSRRKEMIVVAEDLFGKEKVAPICTFGGLSTKVAIKDIGKVLNERGAYEIPYALRDEVAKLIPTIKTINDLGEAEEKETLLKDVLLTNNRLKEVYEEYPFWFKLVMELEGKTKSLGKHAAGCIIYKDDLTTYSPLCLDKEGNQMLQLEMHNAMDDLGLCKMDFLGLLTLDIIDECLKMAGLTWEDVDINHLNLDDKDVFDNIYKSGNTVGIFQMESAEAVKLCIEAKVDNIEDVIAINAFNRPGTKSGFPTYVANKQNPEQATIIHDDLRPIFAATHLVLLYQEQALQIFRLAGFDESEVDNARRAIGKKEAETMRALKGKFHSGLKSRGWEDWQIDEVWVLMEKQAEYSFNRGHSVAYGLLSYLTAYLKHYYPVEFMTACLNADIDDTAKTGILLNECKRLGIKVSPPSINKSMMLYAPNPEKKEILFGLQPIKGLGESASTFVMENRPYTSLEDFFVKATSKESPLNKATIVALIKAGCLPVKSKNSTLVKFAKFTFKGSEYKDVKTLPPKLKLLNDWNIDADSYETKEERLFVYNQKRKEKFDKEQLIRLDKHLREFEDKYIEDESLYEFETLGMFLTDNPFDNLTKDIRKLSEIEDGSDCTIVCSIIDVKRKKDKKNKQYAYLDLFTTEGIIEGIAWASCYAVYSDLIKKGSHIAIYCTKSDDKAIVKEVKTLNQWKLDRGIE